MKVYPKLIPPQMSVANLVYRKQIRSWALESKSNRLWLLAQCAESFSFFVETFGWLIEPRAESGKSPIMPFVFWPSQRRFIVVLQE